MYKIMKQIKNKYKTQKQTTTKELQAPDLGQAQTECGGVKHAIGRQPSLNLEQWCINKL